MATYARGSPPSRCAEHLGRIENSNLKEVFLQWFASKLVGLSCIGTIFLEKVKPNWNIFWRKPHKIAQLCVGGHQVNIATGRNLTHDVHMLENVSCCTHNGVC